MAPPAAPPSPSSSKDGRATDAGPVDPSGSSKSKMVEDAANEAGAPTPEEEDERANAGRDSRHQTREEEGAH